MSRPKTKDQNKPPLNQPELRLKIDIRDDMMGPGKLQLLALLEETRSIAAAARQMGIGYRRAYFLLETLQACFAAPLFTTTRGGGGTGGTELTETGRQLIARHQKFEAEMRATAADFLGWLEQNQSKPA